MLTHIFAYAIAFIMAFMGNVVVQSTQVYKLHSLNIDLGELYGIQVLVPSDAK